MKIKNNTNKPIGIGTLNLLPGATEELPEAYVGHPIVEFLATKLYDGEHTHVELIEEEKKPAKAKAEPKEETETDAAGKEEKKPASKAKTSK